MIKGSSKPSRDVKRAESLQVDTEPAKANRRKPARRETSLRDATLQAATLAGGAHGLVGYLQQQAIEHPVPFLTFLGKVSPLQLDGEADRPMAVTFRTVYERGVSE